MTSYILMKDYAKYFDIHEGDIVFISSDAGLMAYEAFKNKAAKSAADLNAFIDGLIDVVGPSGTVILPTYNWDFCKGITFDYRHTPCRTGALGKLALKRKDFRRTKHPIYSFAVHGKYQNQLVSMNNTDSFGIDSPFHFFREHNVINIIIDVSLLHSFTFVHYVEEISGVVKYRYIKNFTAGYIDENGAEDVRTYSMFVRDLDLNVESAIDPIEEDLLYCNAEKKFCVNSSVIRRLEFAKAFPVILDDVCKNHSRKLCTYKGQP